jgi:hypothetical protein
VAAELLTGASALVCGGLLALRPDGSLLGLPVRVLSGAGLIAFEAVEWRWLGFHPLQAVFMVVGAGVAGLAVADLVARTPSAVAEMSAGPTAAVVGRPDRRLQ